MGKVTRVGLISANPEGGWARESHVPALDLLPGFLALVGGAPRGFLSGRLTLLRNGEPQAVDEGGLAALADAALNVGATYAQLQSDIDTGSSTAPGFDHAVRLARLIRDTTLAAGTDQRQTARDWPSEMLSAGGAHMLQRN